MLKMKPTFLGENWGLENETAKELYYIIVEPLREEKGITDAHNHLSARQIVENENFPDIFTAMVLDTDERWTNRDHYITQQAAKKGVPLSYLLDDEVSNYDKWKAIAGIFPEFAGNHIYTWAHLELKRILGIEEIINKETCGIIWEKSNEVLSRDKMKPQALLKSMKAKVLCTTDDPLDDLEYHKRAKADIPEIMILPTFRPDKAMNIFSEMWREYVTELCEKTENNKTLDGLLNALAERHDYFSQQGCAASDHGIYQPYGLDVKDSRAKDIFSKVYDRKEKPSKEEIKDFISFMMHKLCEMNQEKGWITQIHFGAVRDVNPHTLKISGPDSGGDCSTSNIEVVENLNPLLGRFCSGKEGENDLTIVLYCVDPNQYSIILTLNRVFPSLKWGVPWWFNDTTFGMENHLNYMMQAESYSNCAGMVCDGRKILSLGPRHEVYARAVCNVIGGLVEKGIIPEQLTTKIVEELCYNNQVELFGFNR